MTDIDVGKIYRAIESVNNRLTITETKQEERHNANRRDISAVESLANSVEKHCHEIGKLKVHRGIQWYFIAGIIMAIIVVAIRSLP